MKHFLRVLMLMGAGGALYMGSLLPEARPWVDAVWKLPAPAFMALVVLAVMVVLLAWFWAIGLTPGAIAQELTRVFELQQKAVAAERQKAEAAGTTVEQRMAALEQAFDDLRKRPDPEAMTVLVQQLVLIDPDAEERLRRLLAMLPVLLEAQEKLARVDPQPVESAVRTYTALRQLPDPGQMPPVADVRRRFNTAHLLNAAAPLPDLSLDERKLAMERAVSRANNDYDWSDASFKELVDEVLVQFTLLTAGHKWLALQGVDWKARDALMEWVDYTLSSEWSETLERNECMRVYDALVQSHNLGED